MAVANHKIVFSGPVGAGKTTAIATLSDEPPVSTDEAASDFGKARKPNTTVALDYGVMNLGDGQKLHLYGTPGQERFDFMWEILVEGGIGLVLLLDGSRPAPHKDMLFFVEAFRAFIERSALVIGVTRTDLAPEFRIDDLHDHLAPLGLNVPVFEVDARVRGDVSTLVRSLLYTLDPGVDEHVQV
jgi:uncharacterized protein